MLLENCRIISMLSPEPVRYNKGLYLRFPEPEDQGFRTHIQLHAR